MTRTTSDVLPRGKAQMRKHVFASRISMTQSSRRRKPGQEAARFKTDKDTGKMIIDRDFGSAGEIDTEKQATTDVAGTAYRESITSVDGFTRAPKGRIKFNKDTKKRRLEGEDAEVGHEFKAKKAGVMLSEKKSRPICLLDVIASRETRAVGKSKPNRYHGQLGKQVQSEGKRNGTISRKEEYRGPTKWADAGNEAKWDDTVPDIRRVMGHARKILHTSMSFPPVLYVSAIFEFCEWNGWPGGVRNHVGVRICTRMRYKTKDGWWWGGEWMRHK